MNLIPTFLFNLLSAPNSTSLSEKKFKKRLNRLILKDKLDFKKDKDKIKKDNSMKYI